MLANKMLMGIRDRSRGKRKSFEFKNDAKWGLSDSDYNKIMTYYMRINDTLNYLVVVN